MRLEQRELWRSRGRVPAQACAFCEFRWVAEGHEDHPSGASAELGAAMLEGTATWLQGFTHALEGEELPRPIDFSHETDHLDR